MRTQKVIVFSAIRGLENQSQTRYAQKCLFSFLFFIIVSNIFKFLSYFHYFFILARLDRLIQVFLCSIIFVIN
jgi:hypothetical protein